MIQFRGITIYQGAADKVLAAFDAQTDHTGKPKTVGAFYDNGQKAVVLDGADYDLFCAQNNVDLTKPGTEAHKGYHYYHPVTFSYFANQIDTYVTAHPAQDTSGQPVSNVSV